MDWLERKLRSIGKESFEQDYDVYEAYWTGQYSRRDAVGALVGRKRSKDENGAGWRLRAAAAIFDASMQDEARDRACNRKRVR